MTIRLVTEDDIGMPILLKGRLLMPYTQTCVVGVAGDFKGGMHQLMAPYCDCFLPTDTRALADVLAAIGSKVRREGDEEKYGSLVARAKAELYELAGADLTQFVAAP